MADVSLCSCGGAIIYIDWRPMIRTVDAVGGGHVELSAPIGEGRKQGHSDDHFECDNCGTWFELEHIVTDASRQIVLSFG